MIDQVPRRFDEKHMAAEKSSGSGFVDQHGNPTLGEMVHHWIGSRENLLDARDKPRVLPSMWDLPGSAGA